jgi:hypothetical protein
MPRRKIDMTGGKVLFKVSFALLAFAAIVTEIVVLLERGIFNPANFFSFFTVQSNIFASAMLMFGAAFLLAGTASRKLDFFRGAATLYMLVTGVVFAILLSGLEGIIFTAVPWDNIVLHYIMPLVMIIDRLWDNPSQTVTFRRALKWLIYPVVFVGYTLIRGIFANWYPYPFLDPANGGYVSVALVTMVILIGCVVGLYLVTRVNGKKRGPVGLFTMFRDRSVL